MTNLSIQQLESLHSILQNPISPSCAPPSCVPQSCAPPSCAPPSWEIFNSTAPYGPKEKFIINEYMEKKITAIDAKNKFDYLEKNTIYERH